MSQLTPEPQLFGGQRVRITRAAGRSSAGSVIWVRRDQRDVLFAVVTGHELLWNWRCWRSVPSGERIELEAA